MRAKTKTGNGSRIGETVNHCSNVRKRGKAKNKLRRMSTGQKIVNHGLGIHGWKLYDILRCVDDCLIS
jgi:hypothetical protein